MLGWLKKLARREEHMLKRGVSMNHLVRGVVVVFCLAVMVALWPASTAKAQTTTPIRIGVLHDTTGVLSSQGADLNDGLKLYINEIGYEVAGRKIELLFEDSESKVDPGLTKLRKLVERDKVHLLLGLINSALAVAARDYIDGSKVPIVITQATAKDLTQGRASPYIFRAGFGSEQLHLPAGWYAAKKLGYRRAVIVTFDNVAGREQASAFSRTFSQMGGTVVSEVYAPIGTPDWAPYITRVQSELDKVDFVQVILWGPDAIRFVKGYAEYGLKGKKPLFAFGSAVEEAVLPSQGESALGTLNYYYYTPSVDSQENRRFRELIAKQYQKDPTSFHEIGYVTAKVVSEAIRRVNGKVEDIPRLLAELRKIEFEAPRGAFRFDEKQNAVNDLHIRKVEKVGGKLVNIFVEKISGVGQFWTPPQ
jgi:branched-chain amino acid transport system substrate-binding protein